MNREVSTQEVVPYLLKWAKLDNLNNLPNKQERRVRLWPWWIGTKWKSGLPTKEVDRKLAMKTMDNYRCLKCRYRVIHSLSTFKFSRPQQTQQQQQQQQMLIKGQTILLKQKNMPNQKEEHPSSKQSSVCSDDGMKHQVSQKCGHIFGPRVFLIAIFSVSYFLSLLYF